MQSFCFFYDIIDLPNFLRLLYGDGKPNNIFVYMVKAQTHAHASEFLLAAIVAVFGVLFIAMYFFVTHKTLLMLLGFGCMIVIGFILLIIIIGKVWTFHMYEMAEQLSQMAKNEDESEEK